MDALVASTRRSARRSTSVKQEAPTPSYPPDTLDQLLALALRPVPLSETIAALLAAVASPKSPLDAAYLASSLSNLVDFADNASAVVYVVSSTLSQLFSSPSGLSPTLHAAQQRFQQLTHDAAYQRAAKAGSKAVAELVKIARQAMDVFATGMGWTTVEEVPLFGLSGRGVKVWKVIKAGSTLAAGMRNGQRPEGREEARRRWVWLEDRASQLCEDGGWKSEHMQHAIGEMRAEDDAKADAPLPLAFQRRSTTSTALTPSSAPFKSKSPAPTLVSLAFGNLPPIPQLPPPSPLDSSKSAHSAAQGQHVGGTSSERRLDPPAVPLFPPFSAPPSPLPAHIPSTAAFPSVLSLPSTAAPPPPAALGAAGSPSPPPLPAVPPLLNGATTLSRHDAALKKPGAALSAALTEAAPAENVKLGRKRSCSPESVGGSDDEGPREKRQRTGSMLSEAEEESEKESDTEMADFVPRSETEEGAKRADEASRRGEGVASLLRRDEGARTVVGGMSTGHSAVEADLLSTPSLDNPSSSARQSASPPPPSTVTAIKLAQSHLQDSPAPSRSPSSPSPPGTSSASDLSSPSARVASPPQSTSASLDALSLSAPLLSHLPPPPAPPKPKFLGVFIPPPRRLVSKPQGLSSATTATAKDGADPEEEDGASSSSLTSDGEDDDEGERGEKQEQEEQDKDSEEGEASSSGSELTDEDELAAALRRTSSTAAAGPSVGAAASSTGGTRSSARLRQLEEEQGPPEPAPASSPAKRRIKASKSRSTPKPRREAPASRVDGEKGTSEGDRALEAGDGAEEAGKEGEHGEDADDEQDEDFRPSRRDKGKKKALPTPTAIQDGEYGGAAKKESKDPRLHPVLPCTHHLSRHLNHHQGRVWVVADLIELVARAVLVFVGRYWEDSRAGGKEENWQGVPIERFEVDWDSVLGGAPLPSLEPRKWMRKWVLLQHIEVFFEMPANLELSLSHLARLPFLSAHLPPHESKVLLDLISTTVCDLLDDDDLPPHLLPARAWLTTLGAALCPSPALAPSVAQTAANDRLLVRPPITTSSEYRDQVFVEARRTAWFACADRRFQAGLADPAVEAEPHSWFTDDGVLAGPALAKEKGEGKVWPSWEEIGLPELPALPVPARGRGGGEEEELRRDERENEGGLKTAETPATPSSPSLAALPPLSSAPTASSSLVHPPSPLATSPPPLTPTSPSSSQSELRDVGDAGQNARGNGKLGGLEEAAGEDEVELGDGRDAPQVIDLEGEELRVANEAICARQLPTPSSLNSLTTADESVISSSSSQLDQIRKLQAWEVRRLLFTEMISIDTIDVVLDLAFGAVKETAEVDRLSTGLHQDLTNALAKGTHEAFAHVLRRGIKLMHRRPCIRRLLVPLYLPSIKHFAGAVLDFEGAQVVYLDSLVSSEGLEVQKNLKIWAAGVEGATTGVSREWTSRRDSKMPLQLGAIECGPLVILALLAWKDSSSPKYRFKEQDCPRFRRRLVLDLLTGTWRGSASEYFTSEYLERVTEEQEGKTPEVVELE